MIKDMEYYRTDVIFNVTEDILVAMEQQNITKLELARRLKMSRAGVTRMLSGEQSIKIGKLSDICFVLGLKLKINIWRQ